MRSSGQSPSVPEVGRSSSRFSSFRSLLATPCAARQRRGGLGWTGEGGTVQQQARALQPQVAVGHALLRGRGCMSTKETRARAAAAAAAAAGCLHVGLAPAHPAPPTHPPTHPVVAVGQADGELLEHPARLGLAQAARRAPRRQVSQHVAARGVFHGDAERLRLGRGRGKGGEGAGGVVCQADGPARCRPRRTPWRCRATAGQEREVSHSRRQGGPVFGQRRRLCSRGGCCGAEAYSAAPCSLRQCAAAAAGSRQQGGGRQAQRRIFSREHHLASTAS